MGYPIGGHLVFIANTLVMNGGTTFLIRTCKEISRKGKRAAVLVLFNQVNLDLEGQLRAYADVYYLSDFLWRPFSKMAKAQLGVFLPVSWSKLKGVLQKYGEHWHVMGVFGQLFVLRAIDRIKVKMSIGIYHQNEFAYKSSAKFCKIMAEEFRKTPIENILFFNEFTCERYSKFFDTNYGNYEISPIGIEVGNSTTANSSNVLAGRIISVGNLVIFKTYNENVIRALPALRKVVPEAHYVIIGEGENRPHLEALVRNLRLEECVLFKGHIPYSEVHSEIQKSKVFVGSGTAIIEASASGIPSIVGIESMKDDLTYGYFSDVKGYSYNEFIEGIPLKSMSTLLGEILSLDIAQWSEVGDSCRRKSMEFDVSNTVASINRFEVGLKNMKGMSVTSYLRILVTFLIMAVSDALNLDRDFRNRRDQSSI